MTNALFILVFLLLVFLAGFGAGLAFKQAPLDDVIEDVVIELPLCIHYLKEGQ